MNKKLISKCCSSEVAYNGVNYLGNEMFEDRYVCLKCNKPCEVIEEPIPQPIQKEEVKGKIKDLEDIMQSIKEIIIGNSIWRKYPDGHTDFNEMNLDKILCLIATSVSELITNQHTPTPSDTFIESKMKEFDSRYGLSDTNPNSKELPTNNVFETYGDIRQFLKSSLQSQRQSILEEIEKKIKPEDMLKQSGEEYKYNGAYNQALEDIKQII